MLSLARLGEQGWKYRGSLPDRVSRVEGLGFRVWELGFRGWEFRVFGFRVLGSRGCYPHSWTVEFRFD